MLRYPANFLLLATLIGLLSAAGPAHAQAMQQAAVDEVKPTPSSSSAESDDPEDRSMRLPAGRAGAAASDDDRSVSSIDLLLRTLIILAIVLAAMWLVLQLLRKAGLRTPFGGSAGAVQILHRGYLTNRHQLVVVRFGSRLLLLGVGPQGLARLSEVSEPAEAAEILARIEGSRHGSASQEFLQTVQAAGEKYDPAAAAGEPAPPEVEAAQIGSLRNDLRNLLGRMQSLGRRPRT